MTLQRRDLLSLPLALAALPTFAQASGPLPAEHFFRAQQLSQAEINPAGTQVALLMGGDGQRRRLVVVDLASLKPKVLLSLDTTDVVAFHWVSNERLIVADGVEDTNREEWRDTQFYAIDLDGDNFRRLGRTDRWRWVADSRLDLGDEVMVFRPTDNSQGEGFLELNRLNTRTGNFKPVDLPPWSVGFLLDSRGEPQGALTLRDGKAALHARDGTAWKRLREVDAFGGDVFSLHGLDADGGWWMTLRNGRDTRALYKFDPRSNQLADKPQLSLAGFDLDPLLHQREGKLLGVEVTADARTTVWLDADMKAVQAKIDAKLPATQNLLRLPTRAGNSPWLLVWAFSDKRPGRLLAYQRETDKLTLLGSTRPHIEPGQMAGMDYTPYKARDGRTIPAYLSLPAASTGAKKPLPLVVVVHGGPWVRGQAWGWDADVQFLTSRGYAVLQPEFRGSDGFGLAHLQAGAKQWGQAMQDDLADGAAWAIREGIADPKRIAILGGSYGGYAAMMGLVRHPEVFRCAVNYVGVTDLDLLFSAHWDDIPSIAKRLGQTRLIGDPKTDAEMFKANSPVHQAARIRQPVLMAYGRWDRRVPLEHGERMRDALKAHNPNVEWVLYDKEGHGWYRLDTRIDFWTRVEKFLAKHLA